MIRDNGRNPFKNAILAECLLERGRISVNMPYAYVEVPYWSTFCRCVLRAAASCSRDERGSYIKDDVVVKVVHENGRDYNVRIRIVVGLNGLRYGCVSA